MQTEEMTLQCARVNDSLATKGKKKPSSYHQIQVLRGKSNPLSLFFLNTVTKTSIVLAGISLKRNIRITV